MKGPVEPVHRSVPETIQEVIELTGFLCFLFRSTPNITMIMILMNLAISMIKTMIIKILVMIMIMIDHLCGNSVLGTFPCALPSTAAKVLPSYNHNQNYHHHHHNQNYRHHITIIKIITIIIST